MTLKHNNGYHTHRVWPQSRSHHRAVSEVVTLETAMGDGAKKPKWLEGQLGDNHPSVPGSDNVVAEEEEETSLLYNNKIKSVLS